ALSSVALLASARPGSDDYGKGKDGKDIFIKEDFAKKDKDVKVSLKEVCYRNLYLNVEEFKKETEKQIKIKDDKGTDVFIFDGFLKDAEDVEFYFREFCYKDFNFDAHKE
ncbi:hypothetical protein JCM6882_009181, partial [Rhodosporidiobolus microsporus]